MTKEQYKRIRLTLWQLVILANLGLFPFWTGFVLGPQWFKKLWLPCMLGTLLVGYWIDVTKRRYNAS